jgi:AcrR family transcriptional regulator
MARPRTDLRHRLLNAARARFLAQGVDGAALRAIAADARTSVGMVHYYFKSKEALFLAVIEEVYARLVEDMARALAPELPVAARIERLYLRIGQLAGDELDVVRLIIREVLTSSRRREAIVARFFAGHVPLLMRTVLEGRAAGDLDAAPPPILMVMLIAVAGIFPQLIAQLVELPALAAAGLPHGAELSRTLAAMVLGGVGGRATGPP